jgi:hypothetical protein
VLARVDEGDRAEEDGVRRRLFAVHPARELLARDVEATRKLPNASGKGGSAVQDALGFAHWPLWKADGAVPIAAYAGAASLPAENCRGVWRRGFPLNLALAPQQRAEPRFARRAALTLAFFGHAAARFGKLRFLLGGEAVVDIHGFRLRPAAPLLWALVLRLRMAVQGAAALLRPALRALLALARLVIARWAR